MAERKKVLIVDDDPTQIEMLYKVLSKKGYEIISAGIGEVGLNLVIGEKPDVVILDIQMPGMDGIQVCERIKSNPATNDIQVMMVTGRNTDESFKKAVSKKADWYIVKPYDVDYFLRILAMLVKKRNQIGKKDLEDTEMDDKTKS